MNTVRTYVVALVSIDEFLADTEEEEVECDLYVGPAEDEPAEGEDEDLA